MKNGRYVVAILAAGIALLAAFMTSNAQQADGVFDVAVVAIETQPFAAGIGDETYYYVTYENMHKAPLAEQVALDLVLTVTNAQSQETIAQCRQPMEVALLAAAAQPQRVPFSDCAIIMQQPGTHLVRAEFTEPGQDAPRGSYALLPGDLDASNNGSLTTIVPVVPEQQDALPTELTRIFAGLAIFFSVMALVAAGAEVAIDSMKVAVGLKRKVTSMDALDRMEKYLPGQLGALSVSAATRDQFQHMIRELRSTLGGTLESVQSLALMRDQIASGEFGTQFQRANQIGVTHGNIAHKELYNYKKYLQAYVTNVLNTVEKRLHLTPENTRQLRDQLAQEISLFDGERPQAFLAEIIHDLQDPHFWSTQVLESWLSKKEDFFFERSGAAVISDFDSEVKPLLVGVGFAPDSVAALKLELASRLNIIESGVSQSTDTFLTSVRNVLDAVELRRYETQSPSRKAWRILRAWRGGTFPPTKLRSIPMPAFFLSLFFLFVGWLLHFTESTPPGGYLERHYTELNAFPWLSWLLLFFALSFLLILLLYIIRRALGTNDQLWFIGLYGASTLSVLTGIVLTGLMWVLQPLSENRVSGQLQLLGWTQPWWSWLTIISLVILVLFGFFSLLGKYVYNRLVRTAVAEGRLDYDDNALADATVIHRVETLWSLMREGFDVTKVDPDQFDKPDTILDYESGLRNSGQRPFVFSPETTAQFIMQRTDQQRDEETSRLRVLRVLSIVVGFVLAYSLQIDVLSLLSEAFPDVLDQFNWTIVSGETLHAWRNWLPPDKAITVGIVLTAFAASAGSAFWHDRLDQLQASKKGAQAAAQILNQASQVIDSSNRNNQ